MSPSRVPHRVGGLALALGALVLVVALAGSTVATASVIAESRAAAAAGGGSTPGGGGADDVEATPGAATPTAGNKADSDPLVGSEPPNGCKKEQASSEFCSGLLAGRSKSFYTHTQGKKLCEAVPCCIAHLTNSPEKDPERKWKAGRGCVLRPEVSKWVLAQMKSEYTQAQAEQQKLKEQLEKLKQSQSSDHNSEVDKVMKRCKLVSAYVRDLDIQIATIKEQRAAVQIDIADLEAQLGLCPQDTATDTGSGAGESAGVPAANDGSDAAGSLGDQGAESGGLSNANENSAPVSTPDNPQQSAAPAQTAGANLEGQQKAAQPTGPQPPSAPKQPNAANPPQGGGAKGGAKGAAKPGQAIGFFQLEASQLRRRLHRGADGGDSAGKENGQPATPPANSPGGPSPGSPNPAAGGTEVVPGGPPPAGCEKEHASSLYCKAQLNNHPALSRFYKLADAQRMCTDPCCEIRLNPDSKHPMDWRMWNGPGCVLKKEVATWLLDTLRSSSKSADEQAKALKQALTALNGKSDMPKAKRQAIRCEKGTVYVKNLYAKVYYYDEQIAQLEIEKGEKEAFLKNKCADEQIPEKQSEETVAPASAPPPPPASSAPASSPPSQDYSAPPVGAVMGTNQNEAGPPGAPTAGGKAGKPTGTGGPQAPGQNPPLGKPKPTEKNKTNPPGHHHKPSHPHGASLKWNGKGHKHAHTHVHTHAHN